MTIEDTSLKPTTLAVPPIAPPDAHEAGDILARAQRVAEVASRHVEAVDNDGRFPAESIAAAKAERLMGLLVPPAFGGEGVRPGMIVEVCYILGQACASTAMVYAMHQVKAACVARHGVGSPWHEAFLRRMAAEQLLLASSTTEGQTGGDVRNSAAPVTYTGGRIILNRDASVVSYGAEADALVTTARRSADAVSSDQVLLVLDKTDYSMTPTQTWDTLGMRGTVSVGYAVKADGSIDQILPEPYEVIHTHTMVPASHMFWSSVWAGVAASAVERTRMHIRKATRTMGGQTPPGVAHMAKAASSLRSLRAVLASLTRRYEAIMDDPETLGSLDFQTAINLLKVDTSELAVDTVMHSMRACGLSGYRNDSAASLGRHLRDVLSAPIMINNDRILASLSNSMLLVGAPQSIRG
ncbi:MAG TPA: acyl-CoA dehydrogenase family protein [Caulobacteraceae bacterium]|jgi:acyl-CoA dehydrogenase|nr:acyl-CoA dehydrogenase family protein [Caulobacteraceae bacterium]